MYTVDLVYLYEWNSGSDAPMEYLAKRKNLVVASTKHGLQERLKIVQKRYEQFRPQFIDNLAGATPGGVDAVLIVPSVSRELETYRDADLRLHPSIVDLTSGVKRDPKTSSSSGSSPEGLFRAISYTPAPCDGLLRKILILDDVLHTGRSIAGVIKALSEHLKPAPEFIAACVLWMGKSAPE